MKDDKNSKTIIVAPKRGDSLDKFLEKCYSVFIVSFLIPNKEIQNKMNHFENNDNNFNKENERLYFIQLQKQI